jgi:hypothetical protein
LRVFENRVLRGIFGPERDDVTGGWRNLHNEELCNTHFSVDIFTKIKQTRMKLLEHGVQNVGCKRPFGRLGCKWEDNIKPDKEIWLERLKWTHVAQGTGWWVGAHVNVVMNRWVQ